MTVKELREALKDYPEDLTVEVLVVAEDNEYHVIFGIDSEPDGGGGTVVLIKA